LLPPDENKTRHSEQSFWEEFHLQFSKAREIGVAGVQEKISQASFFVPRSKLTSSPAILKLNPAKYPRLIENEAFFLTVAKSCGLQVNEAKVVEDRTGEKGLLVRRFDRELNGNKLKKFHQEDMCQMTG